jgi:hypothetical protein
MPGKINGLAADEVLVLLLFPQIGLLASPFG